MSLIADDNKKLLMMIKRFNLNFRLVCYTDTHTQKIDVNFNEFRERKALINCVSTSRHDHTPRT